MPVRTGKDGKLEYYRQESVFNPKHIRNWLLEDDTDAVSYASSSSSLHDEDLEHSCSPQECPTCLNKDCPNSYEDFLEKDDMKL
jgi:hypothetical protein